MKRGGKKRRGMGKNREEKRKGREEQKAGDGRARREWKERGEE